MKKIVKTLVSSIAALSMASSAFAAITVQAASADDETVTFIVEVEGDALLASDEAAELGAEFIGTDEAKEQEAALLKAQANVQSSIKKEAKVKSSVGYTYTAVLNGFSIEAPLSKMEELKAIDGVKNVYISRTMETKLASSVEMASSLPGQTADDVSDAGYTGAGQAIAIIDSELDVGNVFFSGTPKDPKFSKSDIANILEENTMNVSVAANQVYRSEKLPFVYNYASGNADTYTNDDDVIHGTHVTGIAAGMGTTFTVMNENNEEEEFTMTGVAPDAQVLFMCVSAGDETVDDDAVVAAIDDAVKFGVCAVNLSIGTSYSSVASDSVYNSIFDRTKAAGISVCCANGNEGVGSSSSTAYVETPDYGTENSPACYSAVTAVASANNLYHMSQKGIIYASDGTMGYYADGNLTYNEEQLFGTVFAGQEVEYVDCGTGTEEELADMDLSGKVALVECEHGALSVMNVIYARRAGAEGVITYNNDEFRDAEQIVFFMMGFPVISVDVDFAEHLKELETKTLTADSEFIDFYIPYGEGGQISSFSSWGTDQTLELKPEITAPGGEIYSSYPDDRLSVLSGTSMATPHMTGVMALMNEYLDKNGYEDLTGSARVSLIENMLMSAATVLNQPENDEGEVVPYTARTQGAGLVNTAAAMKTSAIFLGDGGKSKISLGDKIDDTFTLEFAVENLTDKDITFDSVSLDVLTDGYSEDADDKNIVSLNKAVRLNAASDAPESITVPANGTKDVTVNVTLDSEQLAENSLIFTNGFYIDGFVTLAASDGSLTTISMPFMGFRGDWTSQPAFDKTMYDEGGSSLYDSDSETLFGTYLFSSATIDGEDIVFALGKDGCEMAVNEDGSVDVVSDHYNKDKIAISPNGDGMGDIFGMVMTFQRAVANLTFELVGTDIDIAGPDGVVPKFTGVRYKFNEFDDIDEAELPDGEYTLVVSGEFDYEGAETEIIELPVKVDRVAPQITGVSIDGDTLSVAANDNNDLYSISICYTDEDGSEAEQDVYPKAEETGAYTAEFDISGLDTDDITIEVYDMALNLTSATLSNAIGTIIADMTDYSTLGNMTKTAVELTNTGEDAVSGDVIIAFYDEDGVLVAADYQSISIDAGETSECVFNMFDDTSDAAVSKLFIWDDVNGMIPLNGASQFELSQQ